MSVRITRARGGLQLRGLARYGDDATAAGTLTAATSSSPDEGAAPGMTMVDLWKVSVISGLTVWSITRLIDRLMKD